MLTRPQAVPAGGFLHTKARAVHQHARQRQPLPHAGGVGLELAVGGGDEVDAGEQLARARVYLGGAHAVQAAEERKVLPARHVVVHHRAFGEQRAYAVHLAAFAHGVQPHHAQLARRGCEQPAQHLHRGDLARAVGAQKAEDPALAHREAHVVHGVGLFVV